ncbi:hypothetical protein GOBAR_AA36374 [Gossypium barbadense]|uniref:Uncharacterized protein n=1 Tax=Gossypium barbadense TaxID=3634 RepID=A0A2P5VZW1_GOSBA|nr:hypothetical protein GOBAR_AA36374 [Gossypium barbadense]
MKESKSVKLNSQQHQQHENGHFSPFKFAKLLDPEASWDKDQLGDVLHWIRQVVALFCGLLWGAIPVVGGIWIFIFQYLECLDIRPVFLKNSFNKQ